MMQKGFVLFVVMLMIFSCSKKETTPPTGAETNGTLLAGPKGGSKSWKITSISQIVNGGSAVTITPASGIPACDADNVYQFSNNTTQSYLATEGASTCTTGDPATLESGSWALTSDGKSLLIDATINITYDQVSAEPLVIYFILSNWAPLNISQISDSSFTLTYTATDTSTSPATIYSYTVVFTKI